MVVGVFIVHQKEISYLVLGLLILFMGLFILSFSAHIVTSEKEIGSFLLGLCVKKCRWEEIESVTTWKNSLGEFNTSLVVNSLKNDKEDISDVNLKPSLFRKNIEFNSSLNGHKDLLREIKKKAINAKFDELTSDLINSEQGFAITFSNFAKIGVFVEIGLFLFLFFKILKIV